MAGIPDSLHRAALAESRRGRTIALKLAIALIALIPYGALLRHTRPAPAPARAEGAAAEGSAIAVRLPAQAGIQAFKPAKRPGLPSISVS